MLLTTFRHWILQTVIAGCDNTNNFGDFFEQRVGVFYSVSGIREPAASLCLLLRDGEEHWAPSPENKQLYSLELLEGGCREVAEERSSECQFDKCTNHHPCITHSSAPTENGYALVSNIAALFTPNTSVSRTLHLTHTDFSLIGERWT